MGIVDPWALAGFTAALGAILAGMGVQWHRAAAEWAEVGPLLGFTSAPSQGGGPGWRAREPSALAVYRRQVGAHEVTLRVFHAASGHRTPRWTALETLLPDPGQSAYLLVAPRVWRGGEASARRFQVHGDVHRFLPHGLGPHEARMLTGLGTFANVVVQRQPPDVEVHPAPPTPDLPSLSATAVGVRVVWPDVMTDPERLQAGLELLLHLAEAVGDRAQAEVRPGAEHRHRHSQRLPPQGRP